MCNTTLDKRVKPGMVYTRESGKPTYVIKRIDEQERMIYSIQLDDECKHTNWHGAGYGWFTNGEFEFIRQMGDRELKKVLTIKI